MFYLREVGIHARHGKAASLHVLSLKAPSHEPGNRDKFYCLFVWETLACLPVFQVCHVTAIMILHKGCREYFLEPKALTQALNGASLKVGLGVFPQGKFQMEHFLHFDIIFVVFYKVFILSNACPLFLELLTADLMSLHNTEIRDVHSSDQFCYCKHC